MQIQTLQLFTSSGSTKTCAGSVCIAAKGMGRKGGKGLRVGFLLQPQRGRLCRGLDLLNEELHAAKKRSFPEAPLTQAFNRTIMVSWLQSYPFEMQDFFFSF